MQLSGLFAFLYLASTAQAAPKRTLASFPNPDLEVKRHQTPEFRAAEVRLRPNSSLTVTLLRNTSAWHPLPDEHPQCGGYQGDSVAKLLEQDSRTAAVVNGAIFSVRRAGPEEREHPLRFRPSLYAWAAHGPEIQSFRLGRNGAARHVTYILWLGAGSSYRVMKIQVLPCPASLATNTINSICVKALTPEFGMVSQSIHTASSFQSQLVSAVANTGFALELNMPILSIERGQPVSVQGFWKTTQTTPTPRTIACLRRDRTTSLFVTSGATVLDIGNWILTTPDLDCQQAFNLDGGGSTQMWIRKPDRWEVHQGGDPVHVPLGDPARRPVTDRRSGNHPDPNPPSEALSCPRFRPVDFYLAFLNQ